MANCLQYNDNMIINLNSTSVNYGKIILKAFYSTLIGFVILRILRYFINYSKILQSISDELKTLPEKIIYPRIVKYIINLKRKLSFLFTIQYIILFGTFYYITIFCIVFHSNQKLLLLGFAISFLFSFIVPIIFSIIYAFCEKLSYTYKWRFLYYTVNYLKMVIYT